MIGIENQPINHQARDEDFTAEAYAQLISVALTSYQPTGYRSIPWGKRFALWRHDCDYSLNRSLALAIIEAEMGLQSTFFINPHSEFYNLLESSQIALLKKIVNLGHDIGLHFDTVFYNTASEDEMQEQVSGEADLIEKFVGVRPAAFSFHNPTDFHLTCEEDTYGGLVNCYSKRFKTEVSYCSDSNGYWRFRRLLDVVSEAKDPCLQVLTHPAWWQEKPMPPRQRIFRSVYGRAEATMQFYDRGLTDGGRENLNGNLHSLQFLKPINPKLFDLCFYLWSKEQFHTLFIELWCLHENQIIQLCKAVFRKEWKVAAGEINVFFEDLDWVFDGSRLFECVFEKSWHEATGTDQAMQKKWARILNQLVHGRCAIPKPMLEDGCVCLCKAVETLATWGISQPINYNGLSHLGAI